jgi:hypothetical protein
MNDPQGHRGFLDKIIRAAIKRQQKREKKWKVKFDKETDWSEPLRVDNELSNINSWREVYEKDEAALRPSIQDISSS